MPKLSIFSWSGSEDDASSSEGPTESKQPIHTGKLTIRSNRLRLKKRRRKPTILESRALVHSLSRPSLMLLDGTPAPPSAEDPAPRCSNPRWRRSSMQLQLRINAMSESRDLSQREFIRRNFQNTISCSPPYCPTTKDGLFVQQDGTVYRCLEEKRKAKPEPFWLYGLQLTDFRPLKAPFVPELIRILVCTIEYTCKATSWSVFYDNLREYRTQARQNVLTLIRIGQNESLLLEKVTSWSNPLRIATLRTFLNAFPIKPLHLTKSMLKKLIKKPFYDQFLRPNPQIKSLVREIVLPKPRTELDTLAFLMVHIIHAWEATPNMVRGRASLADIYGPLLISFSERPILIDRDISPNKTEEAALMDVILDVCDAPFWNHLSMLQANAAFRLQARPIHVTNCHQRIFTANTLQVAKQEKKQEKQGNEQQQPDSNSENSSATWVLRSTDAVLRDLLRLRVRVALVENGKLNKIAPWPTQRQLAKQTKLASTVLRGEPEY